MCVKSKKKVVQKEKLSSLSRVTVYHYHHLKCLSAKLSVLAGWACLIQKLEMHVANLITK